MGQWQLLTTAVAEKTDIPDKLSDLTEDASHRTVTDTEKSTWNAKATTNYVDEKNDETLTEAKEYADSKLGSIETSTADWNANEGEAGHILNRTHYVGKGYGVLLPLTTVNKLNNIHRNQNGVPIMYASSHDIRTQVPISLEVGQEYIVTWDGVQYTVVAERHIEEEGTEWEMEYISLNYFDNNGCEFSNPSLPFCYLTGISSTSGNLFAETWAKDDVSHTISISGLKETVYQLDKKFIGADWIASKEVTSNKCSFVCYHPAVDANFINNTIAYDDIIPGNVYDIICDDVSYQCTAVGAEVTIDGLVYPNAVVLGNYSIIEEGTTVPHNNEPFCCIYKEIPSVKISIYVDTTVITKKIALFVYNHTDYTYNKLPKEYLPDNLSSIPPVTTENNGAFLRVVNGAWAAVQLPRVEESEF